MRIFPWLALSIVVLGCAKETPPSRSRVPVTCDEIAISVKGAPCVYLYSDTRGGFLSGTLEAALPLGDISWSVNGKEVLRGIRFRSATGRTQLGLDSATVYPYEAVLHLSGGASCRFAPLDGTALGAHLLGMELTAGSGSDLELTLARGQRSHVNGGKQRAFLEWDVPGGSLMLRGAGEVSANSEGCTVRASGTATLLFSYSARRAPEGTSPDSVSGVYAGGVAARKARMDAALKRTYFRSSNDTLMRGMNWLKLALGELVVTGSDTVIAGGLPWDGSTDGRAVAQSLCGLDFASGDHALVSSIARRMLQWQDTVRAHTTYGRIAARVAGGKPSYGAADVAPWLIRETYDHMTRAKDSVLLRAMDPVLRKSLEGTYRYHVDGANLMTSGDGETWMGGGVSRGNRACEQQLLWYLEQSIGSYIANFLGAWRDGQRWTAMADSTGRSFNRMFVDTVQGTVCDHLRADGTKVYDIRPNALLCLGVIGYEGVQQKMLEQTVPTITYPYGVGTLDPADRRFSPAASPGEATAMNGPIWSWLTGPASYALTRYDRQDLSYRMVTWLLVQALQHGGAVPAAYEASLRPGETVPRPLGLTSSTAAMAELVRSVYQDYLGIGVDGVSNVLSIQPKLPEGITDADVTVFLADEPVRVLYQITPDLSRLVVELPRGTGKINFVWMMKSGDAWRGSVRLTGGRPVEVIFGADDVVAYAGDERVEVAGKWNIRGYSRVADLGGLTFAPFPPRP